MKVQFEYDEPGGTESQSDQRLRHMLRFMEQVIALEDPDAVQCFLRWRDDPRLGSILQLAGQLDDDSVDQLLFTAEELFAENGGRG